MKSLVLVTLLYFLSAVHSLESESESEYKLKPEPGYEFWPEESANDSEKLKYTAYAREFHLSMVSPYEAVITPLGPLFWKNHDTTVSFYFYNRDFPDNAHIMENLDPETLKNSPFDKNKPTVFLCNGWLGRPYRPEIFKLVEGYLSKGDYNILGVRWRLGDKLFYYTVVKYLPEVGLSLRNEINKLLDNGISPDNITLVGFCLGAHIVGIAGRWTSKSVGRVVGIDPAGPGFKPGGHWVISRRSGSIVEIIHTDAAYGLSYNLGDFDFYFNGGSGQPACAEQIDPLATCSHLLAVTYYFYALSNPELFLAVKCPSYRDFISKNCPNKDFENTVFVAQDDLSLNDSGSYHIMTSDEPPYGLGLEGIY